jgi:hypothetical protein
MRKHELESKTLDIVDRVTKHQPNEDFAVELKSDWVAPERIARRLAAHANAARGEPILWVIGLDEALGVVGADDAELANWLPKVISHFESGLAPSLILNVNVPVGGKTLVSLYFETERAPYLVKNPVYGQSGQGPVEYELPWRDGNATRTGRRADLLRLLMPGERLPEVEVLSASIECQDRTQENVAQGGAATLIWILRAKLYIAPKSRERISIPRHRCSGWLRDTYSGGDIAFSEINCGADPQSLLTPTNAGLVIEGPGLADVAASCTTPFRQSGYPDPAEASLRLTVPEADNRYITVDFSLPLVGPVKDKGMMLWEKKR